MVILPLVIGIFVRRRAVAAALVVLMLVSTVYGAHRIADISHTNGFGGAPPLDTLRHRLDAEGLLAVHAPYWVAWRLVFESGENIAAIPLDFGAAYGPYARKVAAAGNPTWVFYANGSADEWIRDHASDGRDADKEHAGAYDIVVLDRD